MSNTYSVREKREVKKMFLEALAILSAIVSILSFVIQEIRRHRDRQERKKEAYRRQLEQAKEKGEYPPRKDKRHKR